MPFYTIMADYEGGTYVSQYMAESPKDAVLQWAVKESFPIDHLKLTEKQFQRLWEGFSEGDPTGLDGTISVWCECAILKKKLCLINIVQTDCGQLET